jgi:hypothetical protein
MYLLQPKKIDELIVNFLLKGEVSTSLLLSHVKEVKKDVTKQGFYFALRKLKKEDIVITYKKKASLNTVWLKDMQSKFNTVQPTYSSSDFLSLEDKESVTYNFSTIKNMDTFWGHTWNVLMATVPHLEPLFVYDPHYWFYLARNSLEKKFHKEISQNKRQYLMTVGGKTELDKVIKRDFNSHYLQYNLEKVFPSENYYVTIIGDYITETYLDPKVTKEIKDIFNSNLKITSDAVLKLQNILELKIKSKLKISRNKARADRLKKKLGKNFYIIKS